MDETLQAGWDACVALPGVLRGPIDELQVHVIEPEATAGAAAPDPPAFVLIHNPAHAASKRKPAFEAPVAVSRPVDPAHFNFTKVKAIERVLALGSGPLTAHKLPRLSFGPPGDALGPVEHAVLVNASPFLGYQSLFVPEPAALHPQVMTPPLLMFGAGVSRASSRSDFKLGFNSLAAHASVNHCHYHGFYVEAVWGKHDCPLEQAHTERLCVAPDVPVSLSVTTHYPVPVLVFAVPPDAPDAVVESLCVHAGAFISWLVSANIPHQLMWTCRGTTLYVIPRKPQADLFEGTLNVALAELAGFGFWSTRERFEACSYEMYRDVMATAALSPEAFTDAQAHAMAAVLGAPL